MLKTTTPAIEYVDRSAKLRIKHTGCVNKLSHKLRWRHEIAVFESLEHFFAKLQLPKRPRLTNGAAASGLAPHPSAKRPREVSWATQWGHLNTFMDARIRPRTPPARAQTHIHNTQHLSRGSAQRSLFLSFCRAAFYCCQRTFSCVAQHQTAAHSSRR